VTADAFAAVADPTRRSILETLRDGGPLPVTELAGRYPRITRAAISKHLRVLRRARLVRMRRRGRENLYRVEPERLADIQAWAAAFTAHHQQALVNLKRQVEGSRAKDVPRPGS
jgi:DNA-binding transcriptional ArsR family regulator